MRRLAAVAALLAAACIPEEGPMMEPGSDCLGCHGGGRGEDDAVAWTVAGTMEGQGRSVYVQDSAGKSFTVRTNQAGNFYTREPVSFPISVSVDGTWMPPKGPVPGTNGIGQLRPPYDSCGYRDRTVSCHSGGGDGD